MIFQEVENKELLERNHFIESAIFKGDNLYFGLLKIMKNLH